jgi:hypothetical protein
VKDAQWLLERMTTRKSLIFARSAARQLAGAAFAEALDALRDIPDSSDKNFLLELPLFVIERNH